MVIRGKTKSQYCITEHYLPEVLERIPRSVHINMIRVGLGSPYAERKKRKVTNELRKFGVSFIRGPSTPLAGVEVDLAMNDVSRTKIVDNVKEVAKRFGFDWERASVRSMQLVYKDEAATFYRTSKEIRPDETDLRKKLVVLGMDLPDDTKAPEAILRELSLNKYECKIDIVPRRVITCASISK